MMNTVLHLPSADEINEDLIKSIQAAYKQKPISITIEEDIFIPQWQKEEVKRRAEYAKENPESLLDFEDFIENFERKLSNENR
ncbi:addiction module protein [uncultured Chryseobacterium sp.]|uniref:addiction module protein n=1 Tax=uncultured Chryseobacterium sp. TaxID=259322 RepID=UPI0025DD06FC|nr:addiction module protein [uncultured Chryseobacterium sp.]